jgi:hypothetical protein
VAARRGDGGAARDDGGGRSGGDGEHVRVVCVGGGVGATRVCRSDVSACDDASRDTFSASGDVTTEVTSRDANETNELRARRHARLW